MLSKWDDKRAHWFAHVRGIELVAGDVDEVTIDQDQALAESWLQSLARVVEAMPDDLVKDIDSIQYAKGHWPPDEHQAWQPGYTIFAKRKLIRNDHARQQINDLFMRVDGGHPGVAWFPLITEPDMPDEEIDDLFIEPVGWGSGSCLQN
jgi:hypothetical protein